MKRKIIILGTFLLLISSANAQKVLYAKQQPANSNNSNRFGFLNFGKNNGSLTGYSTPINSDVYKQLGIPNPNDKNQRMKSPTCNTELFRAPNMNDDYTRKNGETKNSGGGTVGTTGVTIIYD